MRVAGKWLNRRSNAINPLKDLAPVLPRILSGSPTSIAFSEDRRANRAAICKRQQPQIGMPDYRTERTRILLDLTYAVDEIYRGRDKQSRILRGLVLRIIDVIQKMRDADFERLFYEYHFILDGSFSYERTPRRGMMSRASRITKMTHIFLESGVTEYPAADAIDKATISTLARRVILFYA